MSNWKDLLKSEPIRNIGRRLTNEMYHDILMRIRPYRKVDSVEYQRELNWLKENPNSQMLSDESLKQYLSKKAAQWERDNMDYGSHH